MSTFGGLKILKYYIELRWVITHYHYTATIATSAAIVTIHMSQTTSAAHRENCLLQQHYMLSSDLKVFLLPKKEDLWTTHVRYISIH